MKKLILLVFCLQFLFLQNRCAKRGVPSGGEKDTIPPVMIKASPKQKSIFFDKELITLNFNEYIKLNEIDKQLIISPPLEKSFYDIKPKISASKKIEIKLLIAGNSSSISFKCLCVIPILCETSLPSS